MNESPEQSQSNADKSNNTSKLSTGGDIILRRVSIRSIFWENKDERGQTLLQDDAPNTRRIPVTVIQLQSRMTSNIPASGQDDDGEGFGALTSNFDVLYSPEKANPGNAVAENTTEVFCWKCKMSGWISEGDQKEELCRGCREADG